MSIIIGGTLAFADLQGSSTLELGDLGDVTIINPIQGNFLAYNAATTQWENRDIVISDLPASGVSANTYGSSTTVPVLTVDSAGLITTASTAAIPTASVITAGLVELATNGETTTGTDATRAVTPAGLSLVASGLQPLDNTLTGISTVTTVANSLIYSTGIDTFATTGLTAYGRSLIDDVDATAARATLGLGTAATTAASAYQPADATLTGLAAVTTSANTLIYATAVDTFTTTPVSTYGLSLLDDADAAAARTTLGLGTAATTAASAYQPTDATLTGLAAVTTAANTLIYANGVDSFTTAPVTAYGLSLLDDANAAAARTTLGITSSGTTDSATANTPNTLVLRDGLGNFSAGTITAALTGVASSATKLATARTINTVPFDGTANITVADATKLPLTGGSLTGAVTSTGTIVTTNTTASTSAATGALRSSGGLGVAGDIYAGGNVTGYSDIRLKTDLELIPDALNKVCSLRGLTYTRIDSGQRQTGLIAQEVQKVLPEAVSGDDILGVAYGNMMGLMVEAIKELTAKVEKQDKIIHDLLQRIQ